MRALRDKPGDSSASHHPKPLQGSAIRLQTVAVTYSGRFGPSGSDSRYRPNASPDSAIVRIDFA
jgi:hypothetical protein